MKKLIIAAIVLAASSAFAAGFLQYDASQQEKIQGFAPNGLVSGLLTVNSTTINANSLLAIAVYSPIDCKVRLMASASKTGSISHTIVGGQRTTIIVNKLTPFINFTTCTGGDYMGM